MAVLNANPLRKRIQAGEFLLGTLLEIPSPALVEIMGLSGFDFVVIDGEHGPLDLATTENLIRAAACAGISPIVRVSENHPVLIRQPLDLGATGVQVPQVDSLVSAQSVVRSAMFAPYGERGLQPFVRGASYGSRKTAAFMESANEDAVLVVHIEGESGAEDLERILTVDRIDVIFIGPYDLSQSLGVPGDVTHPLVEKRIDEIIRASLDAGRCVGIFCDSPETVAKWRGRGVRYAALGLDALIFRNACQGLVNAVRGSSGSAQ